MEVLVVHKQVFEDQAQKGIFGYVQLDLIDSKGELKFEAGKTGHCNHNR